MMPGMIRGFLHRKASENLAKIIEDRPRHRLVRSVMAATQQRIAFACAAQAVRAASEAQRALMLAEAEVGGAKVRIGVHTGAPRIRDLELVQMVTELVAALVGKPGESGPGTERREEGR